MIHFVIILVKVAVVVCCNMTLSSFSSSFRSVKISFPYMFAFVSFGVFPFPTKH